MAEYLIQGETLTSMANKIRILNGVEGALTTAQMDGNLGEANADVSTEADLIAQISSTLEGKASGGGSGSASYDTCSVQIITTSGALYGYCFTCFDGTNIIYKHAFSDSNLGAVTIEDVICGSSFALINNVNNGYVECINATLVGSIGFRGSVFIAPSNSGTITQIEIGQLGVGGGE